VDGEYVYKGSTKMGGPIANISGGGRMSAAAAAADAIVVTLSSSSAIDNQLNTVKTTVTLGQGA